MKFIRYMLFIGMLGFLLHILVAGSIDHEPEIRKITPPLLKNKNLGKKIVCYRPIRTNGPAIFIELNDNKVVAHNYGHGGAGWTLAPGSAMYIRNKIEEYKIQKEEPIAIIGAGVIGLFTALEFSQHGYENITIYAKSFDNLTSYNAGGEIAPSYIDVPPELHEMLKKISIDSYLFYKEIATGKHELIKNGALIMSSYYPTKEDSDFEEYVEAKVMAPAKNVVLDFQNGTKKQMVAYDDAMFVETGSLMEALNSILRKKIKFTRKTIKNFVEIREKGLWCKFLF